MIEHAAAPRLLLSPADAAQALGIGRSHLYVLMDRGLIEWVHIGRCRRIALSELERFVATLDQDGPCAEVKSGP
jgi:excisionase family DNA binding protein